MMGAVNANLENNGVIPRKNAKVQIKSGLLLE
jgi:hypothetical protein